MSQQKTSPIEKAWIKALIGEYNWSPKEIADLFAISSSSVSRIKALPASDEISQLLSDEFRVVAQSRSPKDLKRLVERSRVLRAHAEAATSGAIPETEKKKRKRKSKTFVDEGVAADNEVSDKEGQVGRAPATSSPPTVSTALVAPTATTNVSNTSNSTTASIVKPQKTPAKAHSIANHVSARSSEKAKSAVTPHRTSQADDGENDVSSGSSNSSDSDEDESSPPSPPPPPPPSVKATKSKAPKRKHQDADDAVATPNPIVKRAKKSRPATAAPAIGNNASGSALTSDVRMFLDCLPRALGKYARDFEAAGVKTKTDLLDMEKMSETGQMRLLELVSQKSGMSGLEQIMVLDGLALYAIAQTKS